MPVRRSRVRRGGGARTGDRGARRTSWGGRGEQTGVAVAAGARAGDAACLAAFERGGRAVGTGIASAVALLDVDVVSVGGGISQAGEVFWAPLRDAFAEHGGMEFVRRCRVTSPELGPLAGLSGAAALVLDDR